jgi:hypothetical protein
MPDKRFDTRPPEGSHRVRAHTRTMHDGTIVDVTDYLRRSFTRPGRFSFKINKAEIEYVEHDPRGGGKINIFVDEDSISPEDWDLVEQELFSDLDNHAPNIQVHEGDTVTETPDGIQFGYFVSEVVEGTDNFDMGW